MIIDWNKKPEGMNAYYWSSKGGRGCWFNTEDPRSGFRDLEDFRNPADTSSYTVTESSLSEHKSDKFNLWVADLDRPSLSGWHRLAGTCLEDPDGAIYESVTPFEDCQDIHVHIPPGVFVEGLNSRPDVAQLPNDHLIRDSAEQSPDPSPQQLKAWIDSLSEELAKTREEHNKLRAEVAGSLIDEAKREAKRARKPEVTKWEPADGMWSCSPVNETPAPLHRTIPGYDKVKSAGHLRPTEEAAEKSSAMIRNYSRLLAYVDEHKGDWEADWGDFGQPKWMVYQRRDGHFLAMGSPTEMPVLGTVYMPGHVARELADRLNKGEVEF